MYMQGQVGQSRAGHGKGIVPDVQGQDRAGQEGQRQ